MGIYMKYGNIQGDATQDGFQHWINVKSFSWDAVSRDIKTQTGRGRNREQAQPHIKRITVKKEVDHASGPLYKALCTVPKAEECKIAFVRTDEGGDKYLEYTLTDTLLQDLHISGTAGGQKDRAEETWILDFTAIEIEVKQLDEANVSGAPFHFKYDLATGKGG
jgi:type VI secretion system secreted protein Hcp